jgi:hypothetical protein
MSDQHIQCPNCSTSIPLNDALTSQIRKQLEDVLKKDISVKEAELLKKEQLLATKGEEIEKQVKQKVDAEKENLWKLAQEKAKEKNELEMKDLVKANKEKDAKLEEMQKQELDLRAQKREIEEKEKRFELDMQRRLDEERVKVSEKAKIEATEESRLKIAEKDKVLEQMKKQIEDLRRKSEQGSMQVQGDTQEGDLKMLLSQSFPYDTITDVPAGVKGADLIQTVRSSFGQEIGTILWESKNTKAWSDDWVKKLKDDQGLVKASACILVTQALPSDISTFGYKDGVWVSGYQCIVPLVHTLRLHLSQMHQVSQSLVGKDAKMEYLYAYLSGTEFRHRVEHIVSAFTSMKMDLETEKRSMQRSWSKREKEIERVVLNTSGMYGDLQGIMGASLPTVSALELGVGEDDEEGGIVQSKLL